MTTQSRPRRLSHVRDVVRSLQTALRARRDDAGCGVRRRRAVQARIDVDQSVKRNRPDFLVATSTHWLGAAGPPETARIRHAGARLTSIGIVHYRSFSSPPSHVGRLLFSHRFSRCFAPSAEMQFVNPLLFSTVARRARGRGPAIRVLPNPIRRAEPLAKRGGLRCAHRRLERRTRTADGHRDRATRAALSVSRRRPAGQVSACWRASSIRRTAG